MELKQIRKYIDIISSRFLFIGFPRSDLEKLLLSDACKILEFNAGEPIFTPEIFESALVFVLSGKAIVKNETNDNALLQIVEKGGAFGAASLFSESEHYVTNIIAKSDVKALFLSQTFIEQLILNNSIVAMNYIAFLSGRIRFLNQKINSFTKKSADKKLASYLITNSNNDRVELKISFSALGEELDIGRASLYRALDKFTDSGIIKKIDKTILIVNKEELENLINL